MQRIICHWTAGQHKASHLDREHYHFLFEADGKMVRGLLPVSANESTGDGEYAAHTFMCNRGSIGVSLCCMMGAVEVPFRSGPCPMTKVQWDAMTKYVARLCKEYNIPVTPKTVLSHAEVQPNLGIKQKGKWDYSRLSWDLSIKGVKACGDRLRADVKAA
jgi:N-acetyl-anhydromuramyl-L-alanine amidase AmpD